MVKIVCPHCGAEYLMAEIFMQEDIFEKDVKIIKDEKGIIKQVIGDLPEYHSSYICDYCNKEFNVDLEIKVKTEDVEEEVNFTSTEPVSLF